jgi:hypothetical protein
MNNLDILEQVKAIFYKNVSHCSEFNGALLHRCDVNMAK